MTRLLLALGAAALLVPATASAKVRFFHSPSGNIQCEVASDDPRGTYAYCQTFEPPRSATLRANGRIKVCRGARCVGNGPEDAFTLGYGRSVRVGPFRCFSRTTGMSCGVIGTDRGFTIARSGIVRT